MTPLSQNCGEKQYGSGFKVGPHLSFLKPFQNYETSCLGTPPKLCIFIIPPKIRGGGDSCFWNLDKEGGHDKIGQK